MTQKLSFFDKLSFINDPTSKYYVETKSYEDTKFIGGKVHGKKINGVMIPDFCKNLDAIKNMKLRSDDTFVIGKFLISFIYKAETLI